MPIAEFLELFEIKLFRHLPQRVVSSLRRLPDSRPAPSQARHLGIAKQGKARGDVRLSA